MRCSHRYRLIQIDIPVPDLDVEAAIGVITNPGFILDRCSLTAIIRQRQQLSSFAFLALGHRIELHRHTLSLQSGRSIALHIADIQENQMHVLDILRGACSESHLLPNLAQTPVLRFVVRSLPVSWLGGSIRESRAACVNV